MSLTPKDKQLLKGRAHPLKPIVLIGNKGVTEAVKKEIERALDDHELIKIRMQAQDRNVRRDAFSEICQSHQAELVQMVGMIAIIYRKNNDK